MPDLSKISSHEFPAFRSSAGTATTTPPAQLSMAIAPSTDSPVEEQLPDLRWIQVAIQIAQDLRHDLPAATFRYWMEKLQGIPDEIVCQALMEGSWTLFPSVGDVMAKISEIRSRPPNEWKQWKESQRRAKEFGLLASDEDYEQMIQACAKILGVPAHAKDIPLQEKKS